MFRIERTYRHEHRAIRRDETKKQADKGSRRPALEYQSSENSYRCYASKKAHPTYVQKTITA
jgi:hypothetical protein